MRVHTTLCFGLLHVFLVVNAMPIPSDSAVSNPPDTSEKPFRQLTCNGVSEGLQEAVVNKANVASKVLSADNIKEIMAKEQEFISDVVKKCVDKLAKEKGNTKM